jgi:Sybindin-like family
MVVHNIYIFGRDGACLYYHEWLRPKPVRDGAGSISDDQKMMFGLFFSLKTFAAAMDPKCAPSSALYMPLAGFTLRPLDMVANPSKLRVIVVLYAMQYGFAQVQVRRAAGCTAAHRRELQLPQLSSQQLQTALLWNTQVDSFADEMLTAYVQLGHPGLLMLIVPWRSGLKFVFNTDEAVGDLREHMHYVYSSIFVEYVTKNPLYEPGRPFKYASPAFAVNAYCLAFSDVAGSLPDHDVCWCCSFEYFTGALNKYIRLVGLWLLEGEHHAQAQISIYNGGMGTQQEGVADFAGC